MNGENTSIKARLVETIEHIRDQSAEEDAAEDLLLSGEDGPFVDIMDEDDSNEEIPPVFALKNVSLDEWDDIVLSKASKFGDTRWDFTSFPHVNKKQALINFDYINVVGVNLTDPRYRHWERIANFWFFMASLISPLQTWFDLMAHCPPVKRALSVCWLYFMPRDYILASSVAMGSERLTIFPARR